MSRQEFKEFMEDYPSEALYDAMRYAFYPAYGNTLPPELSKKGKEAAELLTVAFDQLRNCNLSPTTKRMAFLSHVKHAVRIMDAITHEEVKEQYNKTFSNPQPQNHKTKNER